MHTARAVSVFALLLVACSGSPDDSAAEPLESALKARGDELVACKDAKGGKGKLRLFQIPKASREESKRWNQKLVAIGASGELGDERVSYSQGDQPDVAEVTRDGKKITLELLAKQCPGRCDNFLSLHAGGGEDEEITFVRVKRIVIDTKDDEVAVEGEEERFVVADEPRTITFKDCDVNAKLLEDVEKAVK